MFKFRCGFPFVKSFSSKHNINTWVIIKFTSSMIKNKWLKSSVKKTKQKKNKTERIRKRMWRNISSTWQQAKNLLIPAADSRTHFHNWGLKGQTKWVGIVLSWLVIRMVLLSISFIHSYNYKWGPLYASDLTHTRWHVFFHMHKKCTDFIDKCWKHIYVAKTHSWSV